MDASLRTPLLEDQSYLFQCQYCVILHFILQEVILQHTILLHTRRRTKHQFSDLFLQMTQPGIELRVYRFAGGSSTNRPSRFGQLAAVSLKTIRFQFFSDVATRHPRPAVCFTRSPQTIDILTSQQVCLVVKLFSFVYLQRVLR